MSNDNTTPPKPQFLPTKVVPLHENAFDPSYMSPHYIVWRAP